MAEDIATAALNVGNALASVRIDEMIVNLARGIAQGQHLLDKESIEVTKLMGMPGTVTVGGESYSMIGAGFVPTFYQFVDTILELKMEVKVRAEESRVKRKKATTAFKADVEAKAGWGWASVKVKASAAYTRSVDTTHAQKYSQDLAAQSLMRTKLVPVPAPDTLVDIIEAAREAAKENEDGSEATTIEEQMENYINSMFETETSDEEPARSGRR